MLGSKPSSWFISSIANIMTCVQRKARRSNLYRKFCINSSVCLNLANNFFNNFPFESQVCFCTYPVQLILCIFLSKEAITFSCLLKMGKIPPIIISPALKILGISNLPCNWHVETVCMNSREKNSKILKLPIAQRSLREDKTEFCWLCYIQLFYP